MSQWFCQRYSICLCICLASILTVSRGLSAQEMRPLFNGRDLSGWVLVNTPPETWSIKDGMLICSGKPIGEMRTEQMFQNFELELEWRHMVPGGNAGIFVWADDITARGQPFHRGVEVQVLENAYGNTQSHTTHGDIFPIHGARMKPINGRGGGSRAFPTEERSKPSPEWNHYRIVCNDGAISLAVNGKVVTQGTDSSPRKGYICIESEGGVVHYRNIKIKELPATAVDPQDVAISHRGYRSIYTGLNLNGWKTTEAGKDAWQPSDWVLKYRGTSPEAAPLSSTTEIQLSGMVIDFRLIDKTESLTLQLPGLDQPLVVGGKDKELGELLEKPGSWNRLEIKLDAPSGSTLNGKPVALSGKPSKGVIKIMPAGPIELANLYVR